MIALDTNILARAIVDEPQADAATRAQQAAAQALLSSGETLFVPITVVQELEWVLRGVYQLPRGEVLGVMADLLRVENVVVDRAARIAEALEGYRKGLDFPEALHLAQSGHCAGMATFDKRFGNLAVELALQPSPFKPAV